LREHAVVPQGERRLWRVEKEDAFPATEPVRTELWRPPADVQESITVIARRVQPRSAEDFAALDLSHTDLSFAHLASGDLDGAFFAESDLLYATLAGAGCWARTCPAPGFGAPA
jgi:hypothetical protein